jgi:hypothetical protein
MEQAPPDTKDRTPSSWVLKDLLNQAPADDFTLGWLMSTLHQRSFGVVMLFLGLLATVPIGSTVPGLMLAAVAVQMIAGRCEPVFPHFITARRLPTRYLFSLGGRAIPVLRYLEKAVHPRLFMPNRSTPDYLFEEAERCFRRSRTDSNVRVQLEALGNMFMAKAVELDIKLQKIANSSNYTASSPTLAPHRNRGG